jgi:hypothetical protein
MPGALFFYKKNHRQAGIFSLKGRGLAHGKNPGMNRRGSTPG